MKFNLTERIRNRISESSRRSMALFLLTAVCCLIMLADLIIRRTLPSPTFLLAGLCGVLWLSNLALNRAKKRGGNPFTALIFLCAAVFAGCMFYYISAVDARYDASNEPINQLTLDAEEMLNHNMSVFSGPADNPDEMRELEMEEYLSDASDAVFARTNHNLLITDSGNKVTFLKNSWNVGSVKAGDKMRGLVCPARFSDGDGLLILTNAKGSVLSVFRLEGNWLGGGGSASSSLTIPDKTAGTEAPDDADPLMERYFPSFGPMIDEYALRLADNDAFFYSAKYADDVALAIEDWTDETITETAISSNPQLIAELNALTNEERTEFKAYIAWLQSAIKSYRASGPWQYARIIDGRDGSRVYMIFEDGSNLRPLREAHYARVQRGYVARTFGLCMIPAVIVFLAFWVFVDAKKRGHSHPALWAALTLLGNVVAWIIYMMTRPQMQLSVTGQALPKGSCPICGVKLKSDFIACPGCGILLRNKCKNCGRALENDWSFCPYCTAQVVKELPGESEAPAEE